MIPKGLLYRDNTLNIFKGDILTLEALKDIPTTPVSFLGGNIKKGTIFSWSVETANSKFLVLHGNTCNITIMDSDIDDDSILTTSSLFCSPYEMPFKVRISCREKRPLTSIMDFAVAYLARF